MVFVENVFGQGAAVRGIQFDDQGASVAAYFAGGQTFKLPPNLPEEKIRQYQRLRDLCDCSTCYDHECRVRDTHARYPVEAEGMDQCLRMMRTRSEYVFRTPLGLVIEVPPGIVEKIRAGK